MLFRDRAYISLDKVDSTNNYAANLLKVSPPPDGTVITAQEQTHGKGQRGAIWESANGKNLLCSVISYPKFLNVHTQFYLSKSVSLAVASALQDFLRKEVFIKWPNDIMVDDKKIGGLLLEFTWMDGQIQSAIVGIGVNVNQTQFNHPKATSVYISSGKKWALDVCLRELLLSFDKYYLQLQSNLYTEIDIAYHKKLFHLNEPYPFVYKGHNITASVTGVDQSGRMILLTASGEKIWCDLKDTIMVY